MEVWRHSHYQIFPNGAFLVLFSFRNISFGWPKWVHIRYIYALHPQRVDIENIVMGHPKVANCAVIAVPHSKWEERPLLVVVSNGNIRVTKKEIDDLLLEHIAQWQLPDAIEFLDALPLTATGKVSKLTLREKFANYKLT